MTFKLVAISDIHYGQPCSIPRRKSEYGHILLRRAVEHINFMIKPDVVVVLGDCLDNPQAPDATERLTELKSILGLLQCPLVVVPGNHDPDPHTFYQVMDAPLDVVDIAGVRLLPFIDPERPGYNAERMPADLVRLRTARQGHAGPIIALQHVPVLPPGQTYSRYGYTNAAEIVDAMADQAITLAIGGHEHKGTPLVRQGKSAYVAVKALCEEPFTYTVVTIDDDEVAVEPQALQMPPDLHLVDYHIHTQFAYCSKGISMAASIDVAKLFGLAGVVFTEHSGQLYFDNKMYWQAGFCQEGIDHPDLNPERMLAYWQAAKELTSEFTLAGLEVDCDYTGRPVALEADMRQAQLINGAMHYLPGSRQKPADVDRVADEFLYTAQSFVGSGIHILAHPFRIFRRAKLEPPARLYAPLVRMLKEAGVAAEINFHTNMPDPAFFKLCLDAGVRVSLGSDAHELYAVGDFAPHLRFLRECGFDGDLTDILVPLPPPA